MNRDRSIEALRRERFDVLVIGGGITGAGVALDAASRGLKVALVEKSDFAHGTSSRSSKQIHGGLRYLGQLQFGVTRDAAQEREILLRLAPHLVRPIRYLLPHRRSLVDRPALAATLSLYDALGSVPAARRHAHLGRDDTRQLLPLVRDDVTGAFQYSDAIADDCRLVLDVLKKAVSLGATIANYVQVREFRGSARGDVTGVEAFDSIGKDTFPIACGVAVNATGVWCDEVRRTLDPDARPILRVSKGTHLVLDSARLRVSDAVAIPHTSQGHHIFLSPWEGRTIVGVTDIPYEGDLDRPLSTQADINSLLAALDEWFPHARVTTRDIVSVYSGIRPLVSTGGDTKTSTIARDAHVESRNGLITITGGKLTTFRRMAEQVVNLITRAPCRTDRLSLDASEDDDVMPMTVSDVLLRRTRIGLTADDHGAAAAPLVADRLAKRYGWSSEQRETSLREYARNVSEFIAPR